MTTEIFVLNDSVFKLPTVSHVLDSSGVFSLSADIVSLCVCTVLLYTMAQDKKSMSEYTRTFALLITAEAGVLFSDAVWWLINGIKELRLCNIAVNVLNYLFTAILLFYFWRYAVNALKLKGKFRKTADRIMNILMVPTLISILANIFVPLYFSVDYEGVYHREPLFFSVRVILLSVLEYSLLHFL